MISAGKRSAPGGRIVEAGDLRQGLHAPVAAAASMAAAAPMLVPMDPQAARHRDRAARPQVIEGRGDDAQGVGLSPWRNGLRLSPWPGRSTIMAAMPRGSSELGRKVAVLFDHAQAREGISTTGGRCTPRGSGR